MLQLIAEGPEPRQRWRQSLSIDREYRLGRSVEVELPVPWEPAMSRIHCLVRVFHGGEIELEVSPHVRNPIFHRGAPIQTARLAGSESFVIGQTRFIVAHADTDDSSGSDAPVEEVVVTRQQLQNVRYEDPDRRIDVLAKLPEVIGSTSGEMERDSRLVSLILTGVRSAEAAAIIVMEDDGGIRLRSWERRRETAGAFRPSRRLVTEALGRKQTTLHLWDPVATTTPSEVDYTVSAEFDWAFCTPIRGGRGRRWGVYVAGQSPAHTGTSGRQELQADIKFIELLSELIGSVDRQNRLEGDLSVLRQFLSPPILTALERAGDRESMTADLEPRECDVTVLFCDLRGFSQRSEESSGDLPGLLNRVSGALEIMTQCILTHGGVTGDFLGDASLGFWGWPFSSDEAPLNACRAALAIRRAFQKARETPHHPLNDFEMGIGISHGRAVAGKIGTSDRVTVTVFGPVVNLASRLETMTKQLRVPILLDESTAALARARLPREEGRTRRLGIVQPYGMETTLPVSELLPPASEFSELTDDHIVRYEQGVDAFTAGRWGEAYRCLHDMPPTDQAQDFLTLRIAQHNRTPPPGWNGIIQLPNK